jgi:hypothetical protein
VTCIEGPSWFDKEHPDLGLRVRLVFDAFGDHVHLALADMDVAIPEIDA